MTNAPISAGSIFQISPTTFEILIEPISQPLREQAPQVDKEADSRKLYFIDFVHTLIYAVVSQIKYLRRLATDLQSSSIARDLGIPATPFSTLKDGFERFPASAFGMLFSALLMNVYWIPIQEIQELGMIYLVDGSLFPAMANILWTTYGSNHNAIRLHLSFELNRMIPVEFAIGTGTSNEKKFLASIVKEGITYVADRGYVCFKLFGEIVAKGAFFVIRAKTNLQFRKVKSLQITSVPQKLFRAVTDSVVTLDNDDSENQYRLVTFTIFNTVYYLLTNRFDLTTFQIMLIYAYRWQIELIFRFLKRTLNGIHLFNYSQNGVQICFYALLITSMLQLRLKQVCVQLNDANEKTKPHSSSPRKTSDSISTDSDGKAIIPKDVTTPYSFITRIGENLKKYWKISCHWLITLKNLLAQPFDATTIRRLGYG
jgi:hypothetical protein